MKKKLSLLFCLTMMLCGCSTPVSNINEQPNSNPSPTLHAEIPSAENNELSGEYLIAHPITPGLEYSSDMPFSWLSCSFIIDGRTYRLGEPVSSFEEEGWSLKYDSSVLTGSVNELISEDQTKSIDITLYNPETGYAEPNECYVFRVSGKVEEENTLVVEIPGGFTWGAHKDDVINVYGTPLKTMEYPEQNYETHIYQKDGLHLTLGYTNNLLSTIWFESDFPEK